MVISEDTRTTLQSALRDLDDGVRALLGPERARIGIVLELLGPKAVAARRGGTPVASRRRTSPSRPPRPRPRPARRRAGAPLLTLVE
jgi:hypothetical protein